MQVHGDDHPQVAIAWQNLGMLYKESGDAGSAKVMFERAAAIRKRVLHEGHPLIKISEDLARR